MWQVHMELNDEKVNFSAYVQARVWQDDSAKSE